jgi:hypothetical protein
MPATPWKGKKKICCFEHISSSANFPFGAVVGAPLQSATMWVMIRLHLRPFFREQDGDSVP